MIVHSPFSIFAAALIAFSAMLCVAAYAETPCPGYVETDGGSAFNLAAIVHDAGSPQLALRRVQNAVSKIDAGGGCSIFSDQHACEETLTLAHKAIVALQTCSATKRG
ncbi:hypothetical protein [Caballeronia sp. BR00000012568055]|uniref:hypothetical protein n=1 Tax=Caballeronia sp. BR00000012568055 TaxID=2918761 RepID=UPI0023F77A54|nr:hypothetical protein [Caballeronia sp. BR00000012568055]